MARSTSILRLAILCVSSTSRLVNRLVLNHGIISSIPLGVVKSEIRNPLSVIMASPASHKSKSPLTLVICLSLVLPAHKSDTNFITPEGLIPKRAL